MVSGGGDPGKGSEMSAEMAVETRGQLETLQKGQEAACLDGYSIIYDELTRYGLRTLHAMTSCDVRPEPGELLRRVPAQSLESLEIRIQEDVAIAGIWHIWMCWHAHERVRGPDGREGVLWYIEKGGTISEACQDAAAMYYVLYDRWPEKILTAIKVSDLARNFLIRDGDAMVEIPIELVGWVPARCVFAVGGDHA